MRAVRAPQLAGELAELAHTLVSGGAYRAGDLAWVLFVAACCGRGVLEEGSFQRAGGGGARSLHREGCQEMVYQHVEERVLAEVLQRCVSDEVGISCRCLGLREGSEEALRAALSVRARRSSLIWLRELEGCLRLGTPSATCDAVETLDEIACVLDDAVSPTLRQRCEEWEEQMLSAVRRAAWKRVEALEGQMRVDSDLVMISARLLRERYGVGGEDPVVVAVGREVMRRPGGGRVVRDRSWRSGRAHWVETSAAQAAGWIAAGWSGVSEVIAEEMPRGEHLLLTSALHDEGMALSHAVGAARECLRS